MYPYPPQRTHDEEPTMIDVRGVLPSQRPAVDATILDEPTSEVPVITPGSRPSAAGPEPADGPADAELARAAEPAPDSDEVTELIEAIEPAAATEPIEAAVAVEPVSEPEPAIAPQLAVGQREAAEAEELAAAEDERVEDEREATAGKLADPEAASPDADLARADAEAPAEPAAPLADPEQLADPEHPEQLADPEQAELATIPDHETESEVQTPYPFDTAHPAPATTPPVVPGFGSPVAASTGLADPELEPELEPDQSEAPEPVLDRDTEPQPAAEADPQPAAEIEPDPVPESRGPGEVAESRISLWSDLAADRLRGQWREVQGQFIDDPQAAVTAAKALVTGAVEELADSLLEAQQALDPFRAGDPVDTEAMRVAMRQYREFLDRVLAL